MKNRSKKRPAGGYWERLIITGLRNHLRRNPSVSRKKD